MTLPLGSLEFNLSETKTTTTDPDPRGCPSLLLTFPLMKPAHNPPAGLRVCNLGREAGFHLQPQHAWLC